MFFIFIAWEWNEGVSSTWAAIPKILTAHKGFLKKAVLYNNGPLLGKIGPWDGQSWDGLLKYHW